MRGVFLHVLGDALGSVAVILSTLVILLAQGEWRFYMDPLISLFITAIIVTGTIPLVKSASYILLQSVPSSLRIDRVRSDILGVKGVIGIHELHIWQLSDTKAIASVHVLVQDPTETEPLLGDDDERPTYMAIAASIKRKLHQNGIHSTTIQPEFVSRSATSFSTTVVYPNDAEGASESDCFLQCDEASCEPQRCCPPAAHPARQASPPVPPSTSTLLAVMPAEDVPMQPSQPSQPH